MKGKSGYLKWGLTIFLTVCAILGAHQQRREGKDACA